MQPVGGRASRLGSLPVPPSRPPLLTPTVASLSFLLSPDSQGLEGIAHRIVERFKAPDLNPKPGLLSSWGAEQWAQETPTDGCLLGRLGQGPSPQPEDRYLWRGLALSPSQTSVARASTASILVQSQDRSKWPPLWAHLWTICRCVSGGGHMRRI